MNAGKLAMTQKILSIKLNVDVGEGAKLVSVTKAIAAETDKLGTASERINAIENKRQVLIAETTAAYDRLQGIVARANANIEAKAMGSNLAELNVQRAVDATNRKLEEQLKIIRELDAEKRKLYQNEVSRAGSISGNIAGNAKADNRGYTPQSQDDLRDAAQARERARLAEHTAMIQGFADRERQILIDREAAVERVRAANRNRRVQATAEEVTARTNMYARMFDQIASGEARLTARRPAAVATSDQSATRASTAAIDDNTAARRRNNRAAEEGVTVHRNLFVRIGEIIGIYRLYTTTLNLAEQALKAIPKAGLEQQATQASLLGIFGTQQGEENIAFIHKVANTAGQSLLTLEQAYRRYAPSAILAGAKQKEVNQSFKDFAEVGTILHLPEEKINSLFLALDQMYAKGVVQSEEVKKQLGNVLPGAVEAFAMAMGKTPAAFMAAMKANEVIAKEAVPKFAAYYRKIFGGPDDSVFNLVKDRLQSNLHRLETAYTDMNRNIFQSTQTTMNDIVKASINMVEKVTANLTGIGQAITVLAELITVRLVGAAITLAITNFGLLATKINTVVTLLTGVSAPILALGAAVVALYAKINELNASYDAANGFLLTYKERHVSITNYIKAYAIIAAEDLGIAYDKLKEKLDNSLGQKAGNFIKDTFVKAIDLAVDSTYKLIAAFDTLNSRKGGKQESGLSMVDDYRKNLEALRAEKEKNSGKDLSPVIALAESLDTTDLLEKLNGQSYTKVMAAVMDKKLKLSADITKALKASTNIPATAVSGAGAEELSPINVESNKNLSAAVARENELLKQSISNITNAVDLRKTALNNSLQKLDFNQSNPNLGNKLPNEEYYAKRYKIEEDILKLERNKTLAIKEQTELTTSHIGLLEKQYSQNVANTTEIIRAIRLQESGSRDRTAKSDRAVSSTGAVGSMQIFKAAWIDSGREAADFTKASYAELDEAGQEYFKRQLNRFKDLKIALAAYKEGPTAVARLYTKVDIKVGEVDPEELQKVYAAFTPAMEKYSKEVISKLPANKISNDLIGKQTEIASLQHQLLEKSLTGEQKLTEERQKQIVSLQAYKDALLEIQATALQSQGQIVAAEQIRIDLKYRSLELQYEDNAEALKYLKISKEQERVQVQLTQMEERRSKILSEAQDVYNNAVNKTNILVNIGLKGQLSAARELTVENYKLIEAKEASLQQLQAEEKLDLNPKVRAEKQSAIRQTIAELDELKLKANEVANLMSTEFASAFDNNFAGFISGTMSAQTAFENFASSIVQSIAKIIAAELRERAIKGIISIFESVGSIGSSASGLTGGINMSNSSISLASLGASFKADGGVVSGLSAASGTILTRPTYFPSARPVPYANGGIVAGEAGHEAVIPLKNGKVKVDLQGGGTGGNAVVIQQLNVNVQAHEGESSHEQAEAIGKAIRDQLKTMINDGITSSARPGGILNPTKQAASF